MWIQEPGKIADRIDFLGTRDLCLYLLKGEEAMIIGGGMSHIAPSLEKQFSAMHCDLNRIKYLVIPHSHFDHCGAVPYLKRKFPRTEIVASAYSKEVFSKEKAVNFMANINKEMIEKSSLQDEYEKLNLQFDGISVDRVVGENDIIDLGDGIQAHFIEVPGHSKCCIATYVPQLKAIFPSDAAPWPTENESGLSYPSAQYGFPAYVQSLKKLASYDVQICAFDHNGVIVGDQAAHILQRGLEQTEKVKSYIIEQYQAIGDLDKTAQKLASEVLRNNRYDYISPELMVAITKTMIRSIIG
jgi:glyoxylase-like metal-dependent hydrolase (beta-lactamase superfamily II)